MCVGFKMATNNRLKQVYIIGSIVIFLVIIMLFMFVNTKAKVINSQTEVSSAKDYSITKQEQTAQYLKDNKTPQDSIMHNLDMIQIFMPIVGSIIFIIYVINIIRKQRKSRRKWY
jgi:hypothetical protein